MPNLTNAESAAQREAHIAALRREREGYVARGEKDRAKLVDEQIAHYTGEPQGRHAGRRASTSSTSED